jgi:hypothetical protein
VEVGEEPVGSRATPSGCPTRACAEALEGEGHRRRSSDPEKESGERTDAEE